MVAVRVRLKSTPHASITPSSLRRPQSSSPASPNASKWRIATLGASREQVAHFLMRILFCLFADSVGLLPERTFRNLVEIDRFYPRRFLIKLATLFRAMCHRRHRPPGRQSRHGNPLRGRPQIRLVPHRPGHLRNPLRAFPRQGPPLPRFPDGFFGIYTIRWFNGGLFIGAHYTSEEDILLLIEPVVMRPLIQRWHQTRDSILAISPNILSSRSAAEGSASFPSSTTKAGHPERSATRTLRGAKSKDPDAARPAHTAGTFSTTNAPPTLLTSNPQAETLLANFFDHLASVRILDPACGSGNFLYVALRRLLDLWKEARDFAIQHHIQIAIKYAHEGCAELSHP